VELPKQTMRTSTQEKNTPKRYEYYVAFLSNDGEPSHYQEAINHIESAKWKTIMKDEMDSLYKNKKWDLAKLPKGMQVVGCMLHKKHLVVEVFTEPPRKIYLFSIYCKV
jgi:hypothetical protein